MCSQQSAGVYGIVQNLPWAVESGEWADRADYVRTAYLLYLSSLPPQLHKSSAETFQQRQAHIFPLLIITQFLSPGLFALCSLNQLLPLFFQLFFFFPPLRHQSSVPSRLPSLLCLSLTCSRSHFLAKHGGGGSDGGGKPLPVDISIALLSTLIEYKNFFHCVIVVSSLLRMQTLLENIPLFPLLIFSGN